AIEGQVIEADVEQESEAPNDLAQGPLGDDFLGAAQLEPIEPRLRVADGHRGDLGDVVAAESDREALGAQATGVAALTLGLAEVLAVVLARRLGGRLRVAALEAVDDPLEAHAPLSVAAAVALAAPLDLDALALRSVHDQLALALAELVPRLVEIDRIGVG